MRPSPVGPGRGARLLAAGERSVLQEAGRVLRHALEAHLEVQVRRGRAAGLPDGTHALASALRQRLDDLMTSIDRVLNPDGSAPARRSANVEAVPPVDESVLANLVVDLGDTTRVGQLVQLFLNELHPRRTLLMNAAEANDLPAAQAVAHTLKSGSAMLGARRVADACELMGRLHSTFELHQVAADVMRTSTAAARWLHDWLARQP